MIEAVPDLVGDELETVVEINDRAAGENRLRAENPHHQPELEEAIALIPLVVGKRGAVCLKEETVNVTYQSWLSLVKQFLIAQFHCDYEEFKIGYSH